MVRYGWRVNVNELAIVKRPGLAAFVAGLMFSLAMMLAFEPFNIWPVVVLAAVPLAWAALHPEIGARRPARTAVFATLGAVPFWAFVGQWVMNISNIGYFPLVAYTAGTTGVGVWLMAAGRRLLPRVPATLLAPVTWTGAEVLRGNVVWDGYPWYQIGHPLIESPMLASPARLLGAYLVSFLVAMLAGAACDVMFGARRRWVWPAAALGAWAIAIGAATAFGPGVAASTLRIGVLQTNLPQSVKGDWDLQHRYDDHQRWLEESLAMGSQKPDLVAWPETMYAGWVLDTESWAALQADAPKHPHITQNLTVFRSDLLETQRKLGVPILIGASAYRAFRVVEEGPGGEVDFKWDQRFNSAMLLLNGRVELGRYDKMQLTPFGEVMPYISAWPWLERQFLTIGVGAAGMNFDLSAGPNPCVFEIQTRAGRMVRIVTPICFEATIPSICRRLVFEKGQRRADVIVQMTNDGWFGDFDAGRRHHALCARWRAVELATPLVRVANTGVSCVVGADGALLHEIRGKDGRAGRTEASEVVEVGLGIGSTPYAGLGDVFGLAMLGLSGLVAVGAGVVGKASGQRAIE